MSLKLVKESSKNDIAVEAQERNTASFEFSPLFNLNIE